jgi:hypothetical protein
VNGQRWPLADALIDLGVTGYSTGINTHFGRAPPARPAVFLWEAPSDRTLPAEVNGRFEPLASGSTPRLLTRVHDLEDPIDLAAFLAGASREIQVSGSRRSVVHYSEPRTGVGVTRLGTSRAVAVGAYEFALAALDRSAR